MTERGDFEEFGAGEDMTGWRELALANAPITIIDGDRGKNYPSQTDILPQGYCLFLSTKNVRATGFDFSECQFITKDKDDSLRKGKIQRNDIVLTTRGTVGNVALYNSKIQYDNIRINSGMLILRPNIAEIDPIFNFYLMRVLRPEFDTVVSGSAQPQLPIKDLISLQIVLPPLHEQKAIAAVLSSLDDKIDLLHRQNATLEAMAEALFRQWFVVEAREEWEDNTLSCLIEKNFGGDWGKEFVSHDLTQVCCIRGTDIADIQKGIPSRAPLRFIKKSRLLNSAVATGDLIVEVSGGTENQSTGRAMFIHSFTADLFPFQIYFSNFCRLIRPVKKECTLFLFHVFRHLYNSDELFSYENGTSGIKNLNYNALLYEEKTKIPPYKLIKNFDIQCMSYWDKVYKNKTQIRTLEKLRDTLLPKLMSGDVRVQC